MFIHNFKYALKILFKNKMLIFWTFAFPIILGTFFNMAFSDIESGEKLTVIDIAVVENVQSDDNDFLKNGIDELSNKENDNRLFNTQYVSKDKAKEMLEDEKISGYIVLDEKPQIIINQNGINETVIKTAVSQIMELNTVYGNIVENENGKLREDAPKGQLSEGEIAEAVAGKIGQLGEISEGQYVEEIAVDNLSYTMIEFYTLIAMACLYGGLLSIFAINQNLPNMSNKGKRVAVSKAPKLNLIMSSVCASYVAQLMGVALLFMYTIFALKVDYGNDLGLIILLAAVGCLAGLSMGIFVGTLFKTNEGAKTGILIAITMLFSFLSGMMGITMKYVVDKNVPIVNKLNPANMITDGLYSLYYYDTCNRYWFNVVSLLVFSAVLVGVSMFSLRRQKYDSI